MPHPAFSETPDSDLGSGPSFRSRLRDEQGLLASIQGRLQGDLESAAEELLDVLRSAGAGAHADEPLGQSPGLAL